MLKRFMLIVAISMVVQVSGNIDFKAGVWAAEPHLKASLNDLAFLKGSWSGKTKTGAYVEEYWSAPQGDSMVGHCRFIKEGKTTFYELLAIVRTPKGVTLRMRHFNDEFVPWQDKEESGDCRLTKCQTGKELVFDNENVEHRVKVSYKRSGAKTLLALVEDTKAGKSEKFSFEYGLNAD